VAHAEQTTCKLVDSEKVHWSQFATLSEHILQSLKLNSSAKQRLVSKIFEIGLEEHAAPERKG